MNTWLMQAGLGSAGISVALALGLAARAVLRGDAIAMYRSMVGALILAGALVVFQVVASYVPSRIPARLQPAALAQEIMVPLGRAVLGERDKGTLSPPAMTPAVTKSGKATPIAIGTLAAYLYSAGVLVMIAATAVRAARFIRLVRASPQVGDPAILRIWARVRSSGGPRGVVHLRESELLNVPASFGPIGKSVLLPRGDARSGDESCVELALRHELTHIARGDHWVGLMADLLCAVQWFNPLAWWFVRNLHEDVEASCDAVVVRSTGQARAYALCLLAFCPAETGPRRRMSPVAGLFGDGSKSSFQRRLHMLANATDRIGTRRAKLVVSVAAGAAALLLASHIAVARQASASTTKTREQPATVSGTAVRAVVEAPTGDRGTPSVSAVNWWLGIGEVRSGSMIDQESILWAENAAVNGARIEASKLELSLPEGSDLRAMLEGANVQWERMGEETIVTVTDGAVRIVDGNGIVRISAQAVIPAKGELRIEPEVRDGGMALKLVEVRQAPVRVIQVRVRIENGEVNMTLSAIAEEGEGKLAADLDLVTGVPEGEKEPPVGAVRFALLAPGNGTNPVTSVKMQWVYDLGQTEEWMRLRGPGVPLPRGRSRGGKNSDGC